MSNLAHQIVLDRKVGSPTRKALLLYMAYRASDDGSGVWASKPRMARELEMGERTVQKSTKELLNMGLISTAGRRRCSSGYTTVYQLNLKSIAALELTNSQIEKIWTNGDVNDPKGVQDVHPFDPVGKQQEVQYVQPTGAPDAPQEVQDVHPNHPSTIQEPVCSANAVHHTHPSFEDFWTIYPNSVDCAVTERAFSLEIENGASEKIIIDGAKAYADQHKGIGLQFLKHSANWLKSKGWLNHKKKIESPSATSDLVDLYADRIRAGEHIFGGPLKLEIRTELQSRHGLEPDQIDAAVAAA